MPSSPSSALGQPPPSSSSSIKETFFSFNYIRLREKLEGETMEAASEVGGSSEGKRMVLIAMKVLLGVVFMGWLLMWVMMPTNTYRNVWQPKLRADTDSTYFGRQGTNMLIMTFPILFIAVLGCVYLHLTMKSDNTQIGILSRRLEEWKRPLIVKGPLGVLSAMEVAFCLQFLALLVWYFSVFLSNSFARIDAQAEDGEEVWKEKLDSAALRLGLLGNLCCAFLFFPVTRGSSLLPLIGLTSDASIKYHVWLGHIVMALFTAHGLCYIILWAAEGEISQMVQWDTQGVSNVAGELALLAGLFMWATTFPRIRRKMFELFFYTHNLYILFLFFYLMHVGMPFFCYILPGVYLFMVDRYLRFLQSRRRVRLVSARLLPSEAVELNFSKSPGCSYAPMSTIFINVPSISKLQWHPFTINSSSNLEQDRLSVIIKKEGSWTQKLYHALSQPSLDRLDVSLEGPYSPTPIDLQRHDSLILISGGSGITPFIAIIRELIYQNTTQKLKTPNVLLLCAFKTSADLTMLDLLLPISGDSSDLSRLQLRVEAFVTRDKAPTSDAQKLIRAVWFKPNPTDLPVAPVLGPNGWLWLAAIISSSFVAFLLLIGILTRYYIYRREQDSGDSFSNTSNALLNLLFICVCIAAAAGGAVLWNKRQNTMEVKQIHMTDLDASSPTISPSSWFYNAERELESVPHQSLLQATTVHYEGRPNLRKLLLECDGSSVGVMASGPRALRHDVAAICSSGLANNLHFESISFSW